MIEVSTASTFLDGHLYSHFWAWHDLGSYIIVLLMFSCTASLVTALFVGWPLYVDTIGLISLLVEANLGTAQLIRNYRRKSTLGMRSAIYQGSSQLIECVRECSFLQHSYGCHVASW
jgi:hypothetical protein